MKQITKEQAIALFNSKFWEEMSDKDRAQFQLFTECLCMPFGVFQDSMEKVLNQQLSTIAFAYPKNLKMSFLAGNPEPSFEQILSLIPEKYRGIVGG